MQSYNGTATHVHYVGCSTFSRSAQHHRVLCFDFRARTVQLRKRGSIVEARAMFPEVRGVADGADKRDGFRRLEVTLSTRRAGAGAAAHAVLELAFEDEEGFATARRLLCAIVAAPDTASAAFPQPAVLHEGHLDVRRADSWGRSTVLRFWVAVLPGHVACYHTVGEYASSDPPALLLPLAPALAQHKQRAAIKHTLASWLPGRRAPPPQDAPPARDSRRGSDTWPGAPNGSFRAAGEPTSEQRLSRKPSAPTLPKGAEAAAGAAGAAAGGGGGGAGGAPAAAAAAAEDAAPSGSTSLAKSIRNTMSHIRRSVDAGVLPSRRRPEAAREEDGRPSKRAGKKVLSAGKLTFECATEEARREWMEAFERAVSAGKRAHRAPPTAAMSPH